MNNVMKDLFPLGSVVKVKDTNNILMIIGYYPVDQESNESFTYLAVPFPIGINSEMNMLMINEQFCEEILFYGYNNDESRNFNKKLKSAIDNSF